MVTEITRESAIAMIQDLLRENHHERIVLDLTVLEKIGLIQNESRLAPILGCYLTENEFQALLSCLETIESSQLEELLDKLRDTPFGGYSVA